jgi:hypothetical protein
MRVFIPKTKNNKFFVTPEPEILSENSYKAYFGFAMCGCEIAFYEDMPPTGLSREDVIVGNINHVLTGLKNLGVPFPEAVDYPEPLTPYLGRRIWKDRLNRIWTDETTWPVFVKPTKQKQFDGKLVTCLHDMRGLGDQHEDREIWCSEPVNFVTEYRCFVRYGKMVDCRRYKGDIKTAPNFDVVESCIKDYVGQPAAYCLDFGVSEDGRTLLIEANDGFAMGSYGVNFLDYAKLVSARWHEMVNIPDPLQF